MKHTENRHLHCVDCIREKRQTALEVFVTPRASLGVQCIRHPEFVMVIDNDEVADELMKITLQPCGNDDCKCEEAKH